MIHQSLMPVEFQKLAVEGYPKHGRGFVHWVTGTNICDFSEYYPAKYCNNLNHEPNLEYLKRLLQTYNPFVEFILYVDFEDQGKRSHLYPRLIPLLKVK